MVRRRKSWQEKLHDSKGLPQIEVISEDRKTRGGVGRMLIPAPREVDAVMKSVRKGQLISIDRIRRRLAANHNADFTCPLTTGIFAWIAAHAADEMEHEGKKRFTPYWRTLKSGGELNPKYPGGINSQKGRLEAEGHEIVQRGKRYFVRDWKD